MLPCIADLLTPNGALKEPLVYFTAYVRLAWSASFSIPPVSENEVTGQYMCRIDR